MSLFEWNDTDAGDNRFDHICDYAFHEERRYRCHCLNGMALMLAIIALIIYVIMHFMKKGDIDVTV